MSRICRILALLLCLGAVASAQQAGIRGDWRTPGGAVVHIAACGTDPGSACVTLSQLEPHSPTRVDGANPDAGQRTRPLCGLQIGYGFHLTDPHHAEDGHLYDPKSGKTYRGSMVSTGDQLSLRGYIGIKAFGRSEQWNRTAPAPACLQAGTP